MSDVTEAPEASGINYFSNLQVVDRFPFSLYHGPIRQHVLSMLTEEEQIQLRPLRILNVGCGLCQILQRISPDHDFVGVDIDARSVEACRQRYENLSARFEPCEPYGLPFADESFDVVFATEVVEHTLDPQRWLNELVRVLKPGGRLQLSTPNYGEPVLPLVESTLLELIARRQGFTRKGLHPTKFSAARLAQLLNSAGLWSVKVERTPALLALIGTARKPAPLVNAPLQSLQASFAGLLHKIPLALAVREMQRLVVLLRRIPPGSQVWDVGCGDGSFWRVHPDRHGLQIDGIDLNAREVALARLTDVYRELVVGDVSTFRTDRRYDVVVGNCSLEHIPDIHAALSNIRLAMQPDGRLFLFVPAFGWARELNWVRALRKYSTRAEMAAAGLLDGWFQHHHVYDARTWQLVIESAGYRVLERHGLGSPAASRYFQQYFALAAGQFVTKSLVGRYLHPPGSRPMPDEDFFYQLDRQPIPVGSPHLVEYVFICQPVA